MYQGLLNCARAWPKIPILLHVFFQMDIDTEGRPGGLWLVGPKLKPLFPHTKLTDRPALREGGRDYKLISPHLSSPLLGPPPLPLYSNPTKKGGAYKSNTWKLLKFNHRWGKWAFWTRSEKEKGPPTLKQNQMGQNGDTMYSFRPHQTHPN